VAGEDSELPFAIGVLADFGGPRGMPRFSERQFVDVDSGSLEEVRTAFAPETAHEAAWRGLRHLVINSPAAKVRMLSATREEIRRDLERACRFDQSFLFKRVHDDIYGATGAAPFSILVGDYAFGHEARDVEFLEQVSRVAAAAHAPFVAAASPGMFGCDDFRDLPAGPEMRRVLADGAHERWRRFQSSDTATYAVLTMPHGDFSTSWLLAARLADSFARHGACRSVLGSVEPGDVGTVPMLEIVQHWAASMGGFTAVADGADSDIAGPAFLNAPTCAAPRGEEGSSPREAAHARLRVHLVYVMAASRVAQHLKVILREKHGTRLSRGECEELLKERLARHEPETCIEVQEPEPGRYTAVLLMRPEFPLHDEPVSMRLEFPLPYTG
jgi:type VI secretion system protein ImpC